MTKPECGAKTITGGSGEQLAKQDGEVSHFWCEGWLDGLVTL
jgi:hypothetical protein